MDYNWPEPCEIGAIQYVVSGAEPLPDNRLALP